MFRSDGARKSQSIKAKISAIRTTRNDICELGDGSCDFMTEAEHTTEKREKARSAAKLTVLCVIATLVLESSEAEDGSPPKNDEVGVQEVLK